MSKMKERWAELEQAAKDATLGPWIAGDDEDSDYFLVGPHDGDRIVYQPVVKLHSEANAAHIAAANPAAILELLEVTKGLAEALRGLDEAYCRAGQQLTRDERNMDRKRLINARATLAKYEGVQSE